MAEILVKLEYADIVAHPENAWTRQHPVVVKPDGWNWGADERPPKFLVIRITDMTVTECKQYMEPSFDAVVPGKMNAIRKWKFDIDDATIPQQIKTLIESRIQDGGILSVTKTQIENFIKRVAP